MWGGAARTRRTRRRPRRLPEASRRLRRAPTYLRVTCGERIGYTIQCVQRVSTVPVVQR
ncbi:hypothetical protein BFL34_01603 [Clavibacter michiganensis]|uniref:Uncharacterized protein n=1 Tax=Clavibacter michiganensis TaxID=28447 RepID=A0A251Y949_9MICO|nr:hypothetical protein BFL34_01603 [Clavibacter michiganensis]